MTLARTTLTSALAWLLVSAAVAAEKSFDFKDPKGVNAMTFLLDSELEPIMGITSGISGEVKYDPTNPKSISGKLIVDASSIQTSNQRMTEVLHGPDWINVSANPTVEFTFKQVKEAKASGASGQQLTVVGDFLCNGVTKELTIPVTVRYLEGKASSRQRGEGDLLVLRAEFPIKRTDFGIKRDQNTAVVADEIRITASIVGVSR